MGTPVVHVRLHHLDEACPGVCGAEPFARSGVYFSITTASIIANALAN
jgi:hypothetical protein